jgi:hypothetical protein
VVRLHGVVVVVAATLVTSLLGAGPAQAKPTQLTYQQIAALPPAQQSAILDPLRAVAKAAGIVGRSQLTDIYSGLQIDASAQTVTIYITDLSRKAEFLAAVRNADSAANLGLARIAKGGYTRAALTAARDALMQQKDPSIESVAVPADGSALHVRTFNVDHSKAALARARAASTSVIGSIPVAMEAATGIKDYSRLRDTPSWIAGEALTQYSDSQNLGWSCTSGLPARRNSDGEPFLITAAHCYGDNASIYTGWENGGRNFIGAVSMRNNIYDAIAIDTGSTGPTLSQEWDGNHQDPDQVYDVNGAAFSFDGDVTCQDGYTSGIVCDLRVDNDNIAWTGTNGVDHVGVLANQIYGFPAGTFGDSGGLVFACVNNCAYREARGIVSGGISSQIEWTEAPPILAQFGLSMAP